MDYFKYIASSVALVFLLPLSIAAAKPDALNALSETTERYLDENSSKLKTPIIIKESPYGFNKTVENVRRAIAGRNFIFIREQALQEGFNLKQKGERQQIIYFCNFAKVSETIKIDHRVGQFLPCRVTVMQANNRVYVSAINPKVFKNILNNHRLNPICDEIFNVYSSVISEAVM